MKKGLLSTREQALWHALKRLGETVLARVGAELESETGLSGSEFAILSRLEDLGDGALGQQALMQSLKWEKSRLSHQLTRMQSRAFIRREPEPSGRAVTVKILPAGSLAISAARPAHAAAVRAVLRQIDREHEQLLITLVDRLAESTKASRMV